MLLLVWPILIVIGLWTGEKLCPNKLNHVVLLIALVAAIVFWPWVKGYTGVHLLACWLVYADGEIGLTFERLQGCHVWSIAVFVMKWAVGAAESTTDVRSAPPNVR